MLSFLLSGLSGYVILCSIIQIIVTLRLVRVFRIRANPLHDFDPPKAAIVLAIRGPDPTLEQNVRALAAQHYPDYKLFIVVDHVDDPAWKIVEQVRDELPDRIQISALRDPLKTCSLKCSAMAQAIEGLDPDYEIVAFADGDVFVHPSWLRELVEPLADLNVGASTGNRWYLPTDSSLGSMTRYFWNMGVVFQVWLNEFVWPGSMALRAETLNRMELVAALRRSLFDGPAVVRELRRAAFKVRFVPTVMIPNREQISLRAFTQWVERQTIVAGTAETQNWLLLALNALHVAICVFAPPLAALIGWWSSDDSALRWGLIALVCYWGVMSFSVFAVERAVRGVLTLHEKELRWFSWPKALSAVPSLLLAHLVPLLALARTVRRKTVHWRGIEYEIGGADGVRMRSYAPYGQQIKSGDSVL
jgi:cellulose synthase/poly-beta-1,6-N-acetylglucosamine synthase-like glycosyltransferase